MLSSVYFSIAACFICIMLFVALIIRKLNQGRSNKYLLVLICIVFLSAIFDLLSSSFGTLWDTSKYNVPMQMILNVTFLFIHNFIIPLYFIYVASVLGFWYSFKEDIRRAYLIFLPYGLIIIALIVNFFVPIVFTFDDKGVYHRCVGLYCFYGIALFYFIHIFVAIIRYRKAAAPEKVLVLALALPITAVAEIIQAITYEIRLETIFLAFTLILIAIIVHKPEENLDNIANCQSRNAFERDINTAFIARRPFGMIMLEIINTEYIQNNHGTEKQLILMRILSDKIARITKVMNLVPDIYYLGRGRMAIICDRYKKDLFIDAGRVIASYLDEPLRLQELEVKADAKLVYVDVPSDIANKHDLLNFVWNMKDIMPESNRLMMLKDYNTSYEFQIKANMATIIARAIVEENFEMYYQPIYSIKDEKFVSAEALIRLKDRSVGFVSPAYFIPVAERSGAIHEIGNFVIESVFEFISEGEVEKYGVDYIELNLSVAQCIEPNLVEKFNKYLNEYNISPSKVNIEITETAVDYDPKVTSMNIVNLRKAGFSLSLDDYGTGFSNIMRVTRLPIDIVKIDKSLVDAIDNPNMRIMVENTIQMFKKINKKILVEGVEDQRHVEIFKEFGCDYIQGYYYSRPLDKERYLEFIREANGECL